MPAWRTIWLRSMPRRVCAGLALLSYLSAIIGVPLPASPPKDRSRPYPCQDRACGCRGPEECWRRCCCFSAEEHWAWARARDIEPPKDAKPSASQGWNMPRLRDQETASSCSQCVSEEPGASVHLAGESNCCANQSPPASCCQSPSSKPAARTSPPQGKGGPWKVGMAARHCQGLSTLWVTTGMVPPLALASAWQPIRQPTGWLEYPPTGATSISSRPPDPPPRLRCV